jgi:hypothetical protein
MLKRTSSCLILGLIIACWVFSGCGFLEPVFTGPGDVVVANPSRAVSDARQLINEQSHSPNRKPLFEPSELPESLRLPGLRYAIAHKDHLDLVLARNPDLSVGARIWSMDSKREHRDRPTKYTEIFFYEYNNDYEETPDNIP